MLLFHRVLADCYYPMKISLTEDCLPKRLIDDHTKTITIGLAAILQLGRQCNRWQAKYQQCNPGI